MAVVAVPVLAVVGMAVNYTRANSAHTVFQVSLEALMLSRNAANEDSTALQTQTTNTFNSLYKTWSGSQLALHGTGVINTLPGCHRRQPDRYQRDFGFAWGNTRLRFALVLDDTGSMSSSGKMTALKTATHNLPDQLKSAAHQPDDVYVSIAPFSKDVNFGPHNYNQSWLRWDLWDAVKGRCSDTRYSKALVCRTAKSGRRMRTAPSMAKIDATQAAGNTNQAIGLLVGCDNMKTLIDSISLAGRYQSGDWPAGRWMSLVGL